MAEKKFSSIIQHPPLRVPTGWSSEEKALIMQLEEILDDIYNRCGYLRIKDNGKTIVSDNITAKLITAEMIDCPNSIPNIVHSASRPASGNNTIWLKPDTGSGADVAYTDTRTAAAAAAKSCPERKRNTFTYTVSLNSPLDLTDANSLTLSGGMTRKGNDFGVTFTVKAKLMFSDGSTKSLGTVGSGRTSKHYNLSGSLTLSPKIAKTVTKVVYILTVEDNYGYLCYFDQATISVAGQHPSHEPSDVVTVHYIP